MPRLSVSNPRWYIPSVFYGKWMLSCFSKEGDKDVEYWSGRRRGTFHKHQASIKDHGPPLPFSFPSLPLSYQSMQLLKFRVSCDKGRCQQEQQQQKKKKNMLMLLSTLPVLQFHSIICTFPPDFHDFRILSSAP